MRVSLSRRGLLAGLLSGVAGAAMGEAPLVALRPFARPGSILPPGSDEIVAAAGLSGLVGLALADVDTGEMIELREGTRPMPPASVAKSITALYARALLPQDHRFVTRLIGTGIIDGGVVTGDLVLAGGGDPILTTDHLATLAARLKDAGISRVAGRFLVWGGALPFVHDIDPAQLSHLGYNPALSGLNLNFNRVHFEWAQAGSDYRVSMDARSDTLRPEVAIARMRVENRDLPVYTYSDGAGADDWTVARSALGEGGSRWLPVRKPALYAGDVFRTLARAQGIDLPAAVEVADLPGGAELARFESPELDVMIRDMLEYSTNITAEALGLAASQASGARMTGLAQSAGLMNDWAAAELGVALQLTDHSGLGDGSRIAPRDMVTALVSAAQNNAGQDGALIRLMKDIPMVDDQGEALRSPPAVVRAKTGTLNFVSALAGYVLVPGGRRLAFAIFTGDLERRADAQASGDEVPRGSREWARSSRRLQQQLLRSWAVRHG